MCGAMLNIYSLKNTLGGFKHNIKIVYRFHKSDWTEKEHFEIADIKSCYSETKQTSMSLVHFCGVEGKLRVYG